MFMYFMLIVVAVWLRCIKRILYCIVVQLTSKDPINSFYTKNEQNRENWHLIIIIIIIILVPWSMTVGAKYNPARQN